MSSSTCCWAGVPTWRARKIVGPPLQIAGVVDDAASALIDAEQASVGISTAAASRNGAARR